jgi:hypothetical protein
VQFEDQTICESDVKVCRVQSGHQVLDQKLTRPEEESEQEIEAAEYMVTFLDALKALEVA